MNMRRILMLVLMAAAVCLVSAGVGAAAVITVDDSGGAMYTRIQAAIDVASPGDEVYVNSGTYYENLNLNKLLILKGLDTGNGIPTVDAGANGSCITISADGCVIEGLQITSSGYLPEDAGIRIESANNMIKNNNISRNWYGIHLREYTSNNIIQNNIIISNNFIGILLDKTSNNTVKFNKIIVNNDDGIEIDESDGNDINNNNISENYGNGMSVDDWSDNNNINNNIILKNNNGGLWMGWYSSNNIIINNQILFNMDDGIYFDDFTSYNLIENNNISFNKEKGIVLDTSQYNLVTNNIIISNDDGGIELDSAPSNIIYHNNLIDNGPNGYDDTGLNNSWDNGPIVGGNYWSDYSGIDNNNDGIGDLPYIINSVASVKDNYPFMEMNGWIQEIPLVFAITPNSRLAQIGTPVTIFLSAINAGTATATDVTISQASSLPATISYQMWDGATLTGTPDTPVDIGSGEIANFVMTITPTAEFSSSSMTFDVSSMNGATAPISGVNTLTLSASSVPYADVIMISTALDVSTPVNTPTAFAIATTNVGTADATGVSLVMDIPSSITGLSYVVYETYPGNGSIKGPATGLTIPVGAQPTFAVFLTPTEPINFDPANNRIMLKLVDGSGTVVGAQSVSVSTT